MLPPVPVTVVAPPPTSGAGLARAWAAGQVLLARVIETGPDGAALLQIRGEQVQARSQMPLSPGQQLRLQVQDGGPPALLRVLADGEPGPQAPAARALRAALPWQRPVGESLATLAQLLARPATDDSPPVPQPARAMLSDLLASLPRPQDAGDAARLEAMVRSSGLFHEAEQARAGTSVHGAAAGADLKARLTAVAQAMEQGAGEEAGDGTVREAREALRGALARIETHQALSARASGEHVALWRMDLPLGDEGGPHEVALRIRRDGGGTGDGDGPACWTVELTAQPPGGASVHARVTLSRGVVHTLLTTEDEEAFRRLAGAAPELERRLQAAALEVGGVRCRHAPLPGDPDTGAAGEVPGSLLRTRA
jgi:hypothetical protein